MSAAAIAASYRRAMEQYGEPIVIRRYTGSGSDRPFQDVTIRARVSEYKPEELIGGIVMGDRKVIVLTEDLITAQFAMPSAPTANLKCVIRGRELGIKALDANSRRHGTTLIAYEMQVGGA